MCKVGVWQCWYCSQVPDLQTYIVPRKSTVRKSPHKVKETNDWSCLFTDDCLVMYMYTSNVFTHWGCEFRTERPVVMLPILQYTHWQELLDCLNCCVGRFHYVDRQKDWQTDEQIAFVHARRVNILHWYLDNRIWGYEVYATDLASCPGHLGGSTDLASCPGHLGGSTDLASCPGHLGGSTDLASCPGHLGGSTDLASFSKFPTFLHFFLQAKKFDIVGESGDHWPEVVVAVAVLVQCKPWKHRGSKQWRDEQPDGTGSLVGYPWEQSYLPVHFLPSTTPRDPVCGEGGGALDGMSTIVFETLTLGQDLLHSWFSQCAIHVHVG